jgi:DNA polymerase delta subunit 1
VSYVVIKGLEASKGYEKYEDPLDVLQNNLPIDYEWYVTNEIKNHIIRIFKPILGEKTEQILFNEILIQHSAQEEKNHIYSA